MSCAGTGYSASRLRSEFRGLEARSGAPGEPRSTGTKLLRRRCVDEVNHRRADLSLAGLAAGGSGARRQAVPPRRSRPGAVSSLRRPMTDTPPPSVEIQDVTRRFGVVTAVDGVSLAIGRGELFALLGPSGCGKTTLLRMIAGFEAPDAGMLRIQGQDVTRVPPHQRPVNMVFQQYALFPHLTVEENIGFGLRYKELARPAQAARVGEALERVRLSGFEKRRPDQLSGGQRQRVALARALVLEPAGAAARRAARRARSQPPPRGAGGAQSAPAGARDQLRLRHP